MRKIFFIMVVLSLILGACGGNYQPAKDCRAWVGENIAPSIEQIRGFDREINSGIQSAQLDGILKAEQEILVKVATSEPIEACAEYDIKNTAYRLVYLYTEKHFIQWANLPEKDGVGISVIEDHWRHIVYELEEARPHTPLVLFGALDGIVVERNGEEVYSADHTGEHGHYPYYLVEIEDAEYTSYSTTARVCLIMIDRTTVVQQQSGKCTINLSDYLPERVGEVE